MAYDSTNIDGKGAAMSEPVNNELMELAHKVLIDARFGALGTVFHTGHPYVSLVQIASIGRGDTIMLLSSLAQHTKNINVSKNVSLLIDGTTGLSDKKRPNNTRITLMGQITQSTDDAHRNIFLAAHPVAATWQKFKDFSVYRLCTDRIHVVVGFGKVGWITL